MSIIYFMTNEIWTNVKGYEDRYHVSNYGRIKSLNYRRNNFSKILKPHIRKDGYVSITLSKNLKQKTFLIHRIVASAFIPNPNNLPEVNHKDENKTNNCVENLEWCTSKYNSNYGNRTFQSSISRTGLKWYTNGIEQKQLLENEVPVGWIRGRKKRKPRT